jgi:hypothetical protein
MFENDGSQDHRSYDVINDTPSALVPLSALRNPVLSVGEAAILLQYLWYTDLPLVGNSACAPVTGLHIPSTPGPCLVSSSYVCEETKARLNDLQYIQHMLPMIHIIAVTDGLFGRAHGCTSLHHAQNNAGHLQTRGRRSFTGPVFDTSYGQSFQHRGI